MTWTSRIVGLLVPAAVAWVFAVVATGGHPGSMLDEVGRFVH